MMGIFLFFVGIIVGAMNSIAGGGMLIGYPAMLLAGIPPIIATATTYPIVIPGQLAAIYGYRKHLKKTPKVYFFLIIPLVIGASIGTNLLIRTPASNFEKLVPFLLIGAVLLFSFQPFIHMQIKRHLSSKYSNFWPFTFLILSIFPLAIYGGYFGVGVGFAFLAFLGFSSIKSIHKINALKNIATLIIGVTSLSLLAKTNLIDWQSGIFMAIGCGIGGYAGSHYAQKVSSHLLRIVVTLIGLIAICIMVYKTW